MFRHIAGLFPLSFAAALLVTGSIGATNAQNAAKPQPPIIRIVELNDWYRAMLVEREATRNPRDLEALAKPVCEGMTVCRVGIWTDEWSMPNAMPVRAPQLEAQEYAFGRNPQGEETSLWNCNKYPEFEAEDACLPLLLQR